MPGQGSTAARGYTGEHRRQRAAWAPTVAAGQAVCARCGQRIRPGQPWDMGHTDDRTTWTGPECLPCNRGAGGRHGAIITNRKRAQTSSTTTTTREW